MSSRIFINWMFVGCLMALLGCQKQDTISLQEAAERRSSLYRQAIAAEQSGNLEESVRLFRRVLLEEPNSFSAHFQLATLLQDYKKDYIGAIHHFRTYLALRPDSDKSVTQKGTSAEEMPAVVKERISKAKELLAPQLLTELGDSVEAVSQARLMKKNTQLASQVKTLEVERATATKNFEESEKKRKQLQGEVARLRELVEKIKQDSVVSSSSSVIRTERLQAEKNAFESSKAESKREAIRRLREEARSMGGGQSQRSTLPKPDKPVARSTRSSIPKPDAPVERTHRSGTLSQWMKEGGTTSSPKSNAVADALRESEEVEARVAKREAEKDEAARGEEEQSTPESAGDTLKALLGGKYSTGRKKEQRPMRVYVVQPGDTLNRIADKYYNDRSQWKKILHANRTRISPDGRIRAGQQILIP